MEFLSDCCFTRSMARRLRARRLHFTSQMRRKVHNVGFVLALAVLRSLHINMSSEPLKKKIKASADAPSPAVSGGGIHFTPELIARMTTFADAIKCPDVMNICLAVGPDVSRTIKHFYLWRNQKYLMATLKILYDIRVLNNIEGRREKAGTNHRAWMEVNADWKTTAVSDDSISTMRQT